MRIGIIAPIAWRTPPENYGGWELVTSNLTEGLIKRGHEVTLFATANSQTEAVLEAVCPYPLTSKPELNSRVYESLHLAHAFEYAHKNSFDLIHNNAGCFGVLYSRLAEVPTLTTLHGSAAELDSRLIYEAYCEQPFVSISQSERELAPNLNYLATVYNGIEVERFWVSTQPGKYLVLIGRMSPDKGIHQAIQVARRAGMPLYLAGIVPVENRAYFDEVIKPQLVPGQVEFLGPADHALKNELLGGAYALLHLVTYREAFGLTMVEAMACGTPVLGVGLGSIPEIVRPGLSGFVLKPQADEETLISQAVQSLTALGQLDRTRIREYAANRFGINQMLDGYEAVYRQLLTKPTENLALLQ